MSLKSLVDTNLVFPELPSTDSDTILRFLADKLEEAGAVPSSDDLYDKLVKREQLGSTAIGKGVAIPHCKLDHLRRVVVAIGRAPDGVRAGSPDGEPVRVFFLVVSPEDAPAEHLQSLAAISQWLKSDGNIARLQRAETRDEIVAALDSAPEGGR